VRRKMGSLQLRDAIEAKVWTKELYERDVARAITPELAGAARCPDDVDYDTTMALNTTPLGGLSPSLEAPQSSGRRNFPRARPFVSSRRSGAGCAVNGRARVSGSSSPGANTGDGRAIG
jgi:hypothetical protein